jgi:hypothetical protein
MEHCFRQQHNFKGASAASGVMVGPDKSARQIRRAKRVMAKNTPLYREPISFRDKTLEQKVQELADREEIRELISAYAHRVAHGQSISDLFTEDGAWTIRRSPDGPITEVSGMAELKARFDHPEKTSPENPMPMIHNYLIAIEGDEASGMNSNELRISENGKSIIASGYYEDRYRRVNGRWKFARRDTTFFHWVPIQTGWAKPPS